MTLCNNKNCINLNLYKNTEVKKSVLMNNFEVCDSCFWDDCFRSVELKILNHHPSVSANG